MSAHEHQPSEHQSSENQPSEHQSSENQPSEHQHGHAHGHGHDDPTAWLPEAVADAQINLPPVLDRFLAEMSDLKPNHIVDLGCGPGVGTLELAKRFPNASVTGIDINQPALDLAAERAEAAGLAEQTTFAQASFDQGIADAAAPADLLWASMSMHHTEDPAAALAHACAAVAPGGRIALAEFGPPVKMLPESAEAVASGAWDRFQVVLDQWLAEHLGPAATNVQWLELLGEQSMSDIQLIECPIHFPAPLATRERDWLSTHLRRGLDFTDGRISSDDQAMLQTFLDPENPDGVTRSDSIFVDYGRSVYTAIRP